MSWDPDPTGGGTTPLPYIDLTSLKKLYDPTGPMGPSGPTDPANPTGPVGATGGIDPSDIGTDGGGGADPIEMETFVFEQSHPSAPPPDSKKKAPPPPPSGPGDPCDPKNQYVSNNQPPPATGDWGTDLYADDDGKYSGSPDLNEQWNSLKTERALGDLLSDPNNFDPSIKDEIADIVKTLPPGMDPTDFAKAIVASLLYADRSNISLSPDLVAAIDYIAKNPDDTSIDYNGLANYVNQQTLADAAALQIAIVKQQMKHDNVGSKLPCSQDQDAFDSLLAISSANQQDANNKRRKACPHCPKAPDPNRDPMGWKKASPPKNNPNISVTGYATPSKGNIGKKTPTPPYKPILDPNKDTQVITINKGGFRLPDNRMHSPVSTDTRLLTLNQLMPQWHTPDPGTIKAVPLPDWAAMSDQAIAIINSMNSVGNNLLDALSILLGYIQDADSDKEDPDYNTKLYGPALDAMAEVLMDKLGPLLDFFNNYRTPPPQPTDPKDYNDLKRRMDNLENWFWLNTGSYYEPPPYHYP